MGGKEAKKRVRNEKNMKFFEFHIGNFRNFLRIRRIPSRLIGTEKSVSVISNLDARKFSQGGLEIA